MQLQAKYLADEDKPAPLNISPVCELAMPG